METVLYHNELLTIDLMSEMSFCNRSKSKRVIFEISSLSSTRNLLLTRGGEGTSFNGGREYVSMTEGDVEEEYTGFTGEGEYTSLVGGGCNGFTGREYVLGVSEEHASIVVWESSRQASRNEASSTTRSASTLVKNRDGILRN